MVINLQESFSEQERFVLAEITFILRKNGGYRTSSSGDKSFPVVKQAGWQMKVKKILKLCNSLSNLFFQCLNRFLALLMLYQ